MTQTRPAAALVNAVFNAKVADSSMLDQDGFFAQDDWEFELDTLQDRSRSALQSHLEKGGNHETALFLKGYLMGNRAHFTPFSED